ncbi:hypothetical protein ACQP2P_37145 [Dactylosporangium sp. CA-139114]|uniref:hypothetical protein n=1 Tax=Dactylosporangium sp. CA-139114 TaxID=3239931 RepID=UPI003D972860
MVDGQPVVEAVAAALEPFDMAYGPDGRWDRWRIDGWLPVRAGCEDDPRVLRVSEPREGWVPDRCDGAPRGLLDFTLVRSAARERAEAVWAEWYEIARRCPAGRPLGDFLLRHRADPEGYSLDAARLDHRSQPVMQAYIAAHDIGPGVIWFESNDPIGLFGYEPEPYVGNRVARVVPASELLRLDGVWVEYGDYPNSGNRFDHTSWDAYYRAADAYLDALPGDAYVVQIHIHS